jgi:hypothetical protein
MGRLPKVHIPVRRHLVNSSGEEFQFAHPTTKNTNILMSILTERGGGHAVALALARHLEARVIQTKDKHPNTCRRWLRELRSFTKKVGLQFRARNICEKQSSRTL